MQGEALKYGGDWARKLRQARRALGLSQSLLAQEVDCRQSAISMMERGQASALSRATLERIAQRLGVCLDPPDSEESTTASSRSSAAAGRAWCPNPDCPSNLPLAIGDTVVFWPTAQPGLGHHCGLCGEVLESHCPNPECRAPTRAGACCMACGTAWVTAPPEAEADPAGWADARRRQIADWRSLVSGAQGQKSFEQYTIV